jgi:hypothetical protein
MKPEKYLSDSPELVVLLVGILIEFGFFSFGFLVGEVQSLTMKSYI